MPQSQECARIFPGSWLSQKLHLLENYLFPVPLLKPKVNYLFNFHLKFYLSVNSHFPQWSTALNEFTKLTAYITTKKEQCSFAELQILGSICLPARWENSLLHTQLCSGQGLERTSAMFKCLWIRLCGLWWVIKIQVLNSWVVSFCNALSVLRKLRAERNQSRWRDTEKSSWNRLP